MNETKNEQPTDRMNEWSNNDDYNNRKKNNINDDDEDEVGTEKKVYVLTGVEYCKYVINTCWPVSKRCPARKLIHIGAPCYRWQSCIIN